MAGAERYFRLLDAEPEWTDVPSARALPPIRGRVEFQEVNFEYEPGRPVLNEISFTVEPGQTVALVGHTGSGKTTVALHRMALLAYQRPRFYAPRSMKVVVPEQGLAAERFENLGATIHTYDLRRIRRPGDVSPLARTLAAYDLLYSHTSIGGQILGDAAARRARRPHLVHQHTFPQFSSRGTEAMAQRTLFRLLLSRRPFIAVAPHVRRELIRLGAAGSPGHRLAVPPDGTLLRAPQGRWRRARVQTQDRTHA
jgi:energy-coupling factor transporter ATP-binding protein EcfA2